MLVKIVEKKSRFVQMLVKIVEVMLLSVGLIYTLTVMKECVLPFSRDLVFSSLVGVLSCIRCFLSSSPTIILFLINLMVLLILASSVFHGLRDVHHHHHHDITTLLDVDLDIQIADHESPLALPPPPPPPRDVEIYPTSPPSWDIVEVTTPPPPPPPRVAVEVTQLPKNAVEVIPSPPPPEPRDAAKVTPPPPPPPRDAVESTPSPPRDAVEVNPPPPTRSSPPPRDAVEVTPPLSRTRNNTISALLQGMAMYHDDLTPQPHEIDTKPTSLRSTQGKQKDVMIQNDEEDNTMDATWKAITRGKKNAKKKSLKKSETWDAPPPPQRSSPMHRLDSEEVVPTSPKWKELRKAETFNDAVSAMRRGGLIRRVPSMTLEEFNQKVEAFINKMKPQRGKNRTIDSWRRSTAGVSS